MTITIKTIYLTIKCFDTVRGKNTLLWIFISYLIDSSIKIVLDGLRINVCLVELSHVYAYKDFRFFLAMPKKDIIKSFVKQ